MRSTYQDLPPEDNDSPGGLKLLSSLGLAALVLVTGGLASWWVMGDFSGEYLAQDQRLGSVTIDLYRRPTSIDGSLTMPNGAALDIVSGHVSNNNQIELSFAPREAAEGGERFITATFQGMIDPPKMEQGSTTISFDRVLHPNAGAGEPGQGASLTMPKMDVQGKVIKGRLSYNGIDYDLALERNSLTSMFHGLKSLWPGAHR